MDVEVNGAGMVWVLGHRALKLGHDLVRAPFRLPAAVRPIIPRLGVHHGFGMKNSNLDVLWKALGDVSERIRPSLVERRAVHLGIGRIPLARAAISVCSLSLAWPASACARSSAASAG